MNSLRIALLASCMGLAIARAEDKAGALITWRDATRDLGKFPVCRSVSEHCLDRPGKWYLSFECPNELRWFGTVYRQAHQVHLGNAYYLTVWYGDGDYDAYDEGPFNSWKSLMERINTLEDECAPDQISVAAPVNRTN